MKEKTKKDTKFRRFLYILFGKKRETTLNDFVLVSTTDPENGIEVVLDSRNGKLYTKKQLDPSYSAAYRYLKKHPVDHTPKVFFIDETDGVLTVIEDYIPGDTLQSNLDKCGVLPEHKVIEISLQLCGILKESHSRKKPVVNRDIVAQNIVINRNGIVKLTDLITKNRKDTNFEGSLEEGMQNDIRSMAEFMNTLLCGELPETTVAEGALGDIIRKCMSTNSYHNIEELQAALKELWRKLPAGKRFYNWRRYLLPGFRGKNVYLWLFAAIAYPMLVYLSLVLKFENSNALQYVFRIFFLLIVFALILFNGNYLAIKKKLPLTKSRNRFVRFLGSLLVNALFLLIIAFLIRALGVAFTGV